jgi:hypothetical protein
MRSAVLLTVFFGCAHCWAQGRVIAELKDANTVIQVRMLPQSAFTLVEMRTVADEFLKSDATAHSIAVLSVYEDGDVAAREAGAICEGGYTQWRAYYDDFPKGRLLAGSVISIRGDAVLRLRTIEGAIIRQVISGTDPTNVSAGGDQFEIMSISGRSRSRFEGCGVAGVVEPVLYLKTDATLSESLCKRATSILVERLGRTYILTHFRNDAWFLCGQFPIVYPYSPFERPPTKVAYSALPELACSISCKSGPNCIRSGQQQSRSVVSSPGWLESQ